MERDPKDTPAAEAEVPQREEPFTPEEIEQLDDYIEVGFGRVNARQH